jgi:hypothetical protein
MLGQKPAVGADSHQRRYRLATENKPAKFSLNWLIEVAIQKLKRALATPGAGIQNTMLF